MLICDANSKYVALKIYLCPFESVSSSHDVCKNGNRPAQLKNQLLKTWPIPKTAQDVASFIGFTNFYSKFIPCFEHRIHSLRELVKLDMSTNIESMWTDTHAKEMKDIIKVILSDLCLMRYSPIKRSYLRTDFSCFGFGVVLLQPDDHQPSLDAMRREMDGGHCEFMKDENTNLRLRPVAFASRVARGYETKLHSHLGEGFAGDWGINKFQHYLKGQLFTWITDCYAIKFVMSYEGSNPVVLRLQMRLGFWAFTCLHRNNKWLIDADYFSRCKEDLCLDPLYNEYLRFSSELQKLYPPPTGPMQPQNMPRY